MTTHDDHTPAASGAAWEITTAPAGQVIPLPRRADPPSGAGTAVERATLPAELLTPEENTALERRRPGRHSVRVAGWVRVLRTSPATVQLRSVAAYRARKAPTDLTRLVWFAMRGHARWLRKGWDFFTYADLRADARAARIAGNSEARRTAQELIRSDARARWARVGIVLGRLRATLVVFAVLAVVLWLASVFDALVDPGQAWAWRATVMNVLRAAATVAGVVWSWLLLAGPVAWLVAAVWEGRDRTPGAGFLVRPDRDDDTDSWIDERMISLAFAHLGIPPLAAFFKDGGQLVYTVPPRIDGDGTSCQIRLPMGVTADMVADKRDKLAANLGRAKLEVWPTEGDEAGILDLWVADKGKLAGGAGAWPLLHDGQCDLFDGVPVGLSQRGDVITAPMFASNYLIGGRPGQGKSALLRVLLLGAALDPTAELWVFVLGQSPDFDPFTPRLTRYHMGLDDTVVEAAMQALEDLVAEMERRGRTLGELGQVKATRKLADRSLGLHPLVCAMDEIHELFTHPAHGKRAAELAIKLIKRGRKYGIILLTATQSPTADSIPKDLTRNMSCGIAFSVADHVANDGLLGSGKFRQGIRATELRMHTDRGTCVAVGLTAASFELVRTFYVAFDEDADQVSPVIRRALNLLADTGRTLASTADTDPPPPVDVLADVAEVLGTDKRVRTQVVLTRLAERNALAYEGWTHIDLKTALAEFDIRAVKSDGVMVIRADDVTLALTERNTEGEGS